MDNVEYSRIFHRVSYFHVSPKFYTNEFLHFPMSLPLFLLIVFSYKYMFARIWHERMQNIIIEYLSTFSLSFSLFANRVKPCCKALLSDEMYFAHLL